jgi:transcriptional regulator with XRE-family HTH domain
MPPIGGSQRDPSVRVRATRDIGNAIRARRRGLGWSQTELASRAAVSRKWVSETERGASVAGVRNLLAVFEALGVTLVLRTEEDDLPSAANLRDHVDLDAILAAHRSG